MAHRIVERGFDIEFPTFNNLSKYHSRHRFLPLHRESVNTNMATEAPPAVPSAELATPAVRPQELSFSLPRALHTTAHVHLTFLGNCATIFLATSSPGDSGGSIKPMGSFVYAMPDVSTLSAKCGILAIFKERQCHFLMSYHMEEWPYCLA